jgi:hypothetical protein
VVKKLKVGDVFLVPTGDGRAGVGQVVATYGSHSYYFAIYEAVFPLETAADRVADALSAPVLFLALSLDAKLYVGHWTVIGHAPVADDMPFPAYKVAVAAPDNIEVIDYSGKRHRPATELEAELLPYRNTVGPVRFEKALRAWLGLDPWDEAFDELRPIGRIRTADIFS